MADENVQISAFVARETKERLDAYAARTGIKKGHVIEEAVDAYLAASEETPSEYVTPREVVLTPESFERVAEMIADAPQASGALRNVMRGREGSRVQIPPHSATWAGVTKSSRRARAMCRRSESLAMSHSLIAGEARFQP